MHKEIDDFPGYIIYKDGRIIKIWESMKEASKKGFCESSISRCCLGKRKLCGGFQWRYANE